MCVPIFFELKESGTFLQGCGSGMIYSGLHIAERNILEDLLLQSVFFYIGEWGKIAHTSN